MNLSQHNFLHGTVIKRYNSDTTGASDKKFDRYSYETMGGLYDVDIEQDTGNKTYHVNCGANIFPNIHAIHKQIEKHFNL